jgi:hypothetical protein
MDWVSCHLLSVEKGAARRSSDQAVRKNVEAELPHARPPTRIIFSRSRQANIRRLPVLICAPGIMHNKVRGKQDVHFGHHHGDKRRDGENKGSWQNKAEFLWRGIVQDMNQGP